VGGADWSNVRNLALWARLELITAGIASGLAVITIFSQEWIEAIFAVDPDGGSGVLEWRIVFGLALFAIAASTLGVRTWRTARGVSR
jgi:hypothetical protein